MWNIRISISITLKHLTAYTALDLPSVVLCRVITANDCYIESIYYHGYFLLAIKVRFIKFTHVLSTVLPQCLSSCLLAQVGHLLFLLHQTKIIHYCSKVWGH